ncbi:hypothetical protein PPYR_10561 [Photinus pyralis]|uniref:Lipid-binding serum glycoprotein N-terminal domain-containing protein n=1 Tax=Photinus pyralis TaxID=7054 RepID=A0A1Y1KA76_PHOPY|nr:uncharacterized protein LOC116174724 [Photinus pyralis]KAB0796500.1 hypothetical protein PPYR_10561 [Photinus pyralis]
MDELLNVDKELFNKFLNFLKLYDPFQIDARTAFDFFGFYVSIEKIKIEGFSNVLTDISINPGLPRSTLTFELRLPKISGYIKSYASNVPFIYGRCNGRFHLKNMKLNVLVVYNLFEGLLPISVTTSVKMAQVIITGFNGNEELSTSLSRKISEFLKNVINSSQTHEIIESFINGVVTGFMKAKDPIPTLNI